MSRPTTSQRQRKFRSVTLESLQRRELMAMDAAFFSYDLWMPPEASRELTAQEWATRVTFPNNQAQLPGSVLRMTSEDATREFLVEQLAASWSNLLGKQLDSKLQNGWYHIDWNFATLRDVAPKDTPLAEAFQFQSGTVASNTPLQNKNILIAGVDEQDQYAISSSGIVFLRAGDSGNQIQVIDVKDPAAPKRLTTIDIGQASNTQLLLTGNSLIVISAVMEPTESEWAFTNATEIRAYDVSKPDQPALTSRWKLDGTVLEARMAGDRLTLISEEYRTLLQPKFFAVDPTAKYEALTDEVIGRFETSEEYAARIRPLVLEWVSGNVTNFDVSTPVTSELAQWDDLILREGTSLNQFTSVTTFQFTNNSLALVDSEVVVGISQQLILADADSVYLQRPDQGKTEIIELSLNDSSVKFEGTGSVAGSIAGTRMVDEFDGYLRVFSNSGSFVDGMFSNSTNLSVLQRSGTELKIVGKLNDIADGQSLLSAVFMGEKAVITTGETVQLIDPLHGIDLSDPTNPVELSDKVIPGWSTFLQPVGENLMVGLGFAQGEDGQWRNQLSLYDIADLANPKVLSTWVSDDVVFPRFDSFRQQALAIQFDAATGLLTVPLHVSNAPWLSPRLFMSPVPGPLAQKDTGLYVFKIDPSSAQPLKLVDQVGEDVNRGTIVGNTLLTFSKAVLQTYEIEKDELQWMSTTFVGNPVGAPFSWVIHGSTASIDLLDGSFTQGATVTAIGTSSLGAELSLVDGRTLIYRLPKDLKLTNWTPDVISFTVTYDNGETFTSSVHISCIPRGGDDEFIVPPVVPPVDLPITQPQDPYAHDTTLLEIDVQFVDDSGEVVTNLESGQEYWLQLTATDKRENPNGVYGTWVDLTFASGTLTVVGKAEGIGDYKNTVRGSMSGSDKIEALGAFSNLFQFPNTTTSEIARVRVRAGELGSLNLNVEQAAGKANESLLFGSNFNVQISQMKFNSPNVSVIDSHDTNADGEITPLDALILIDQLSRSRTTGESESAKTQSLTANRMRAAQLDVSGDGELSPVDVLMVIDFLSTKNSASKLQRIQAAGESTSTITTSATNTEPANIDAAIATSTVQDEDLIAALACNFLEGESSLKKSKR